MSWGVNVSVSKGGREGGRGRGVSLSYGREGGREGGRGSRGRFVIACPWTADGGGDESDAEGGG